MKKKLAVIFGVLCCVLILGFSNSAEAAGNSHMRIYGIYLGNSQGDAVLVESGGEYLLMDMGEAASYPYVKAFLQKMNVEHLSLYLSHMHADHTGGLRDGEGYNRLLQDFKVDKVYAPERSITKLVDQTWNYQKIEELYAECYPDADLGTAIQYLKVGSTFSVGDVSARVIGPIGMENVSLSQFAEENDYVNSCSLVTKLTCGNTTYLTAGDCEVEGERGLIRQYGKGLKADIFKLSHHGYASGNSEDFMSYIAPTYSFGLNSGDATGFTNPNTTNHRVTYTARYNASQYGICYMVGDEKQAVAIDVQNDVVRLYKESNLTNPLTGWVRLFGSDGVNELYDYYYLGADGKPLTGIQNIGGKTYYLGTGGCRVTGYYKKENGKAVYVGWRKYEEKGSSYQMRYFVKDTGEMATGWLNEGGNTYYMAKDTGYRVSGLQAIDGKTYYFGNAGTLFTNRWVDLKDGRRYFNGKGVMQTGFITLKGNIYHLGKNGILTTGGDDWPLVKIGNKYYAVSKSGIVYNKGWKKYKVGKSNKYRCFNSKGVMKTGWLKNKGNTYYLDLDTGYRVTGLQKINNKFYYFSNAGIMAQNKTVKIDGTSYKFGKNGAMTNAPKLSKVKIKKAKAGKKSIGLTWSKVKNADGYEIYASTKKNGNYKRVATVKNGKTTKYTVKKLTSKKIYYVKMKAYKKIGGLKVYGSFSSVTSQKAK